MVDEVHARAAFVVGAHYVPGTRGGEHRLFRNDVGVNAVNSGQVDRGDFSAFRRVHRPGPQVSVPFFAGDREVALVQGDDDGKDR